jgi:uncharacterized protein (TIGR03085 family)
MAEQLDIRERHLLCDLFLELGPDVPTLCEGWTAFDLATHLVVRERSLRGAPGIVLGDKVKALAEQTKMAQERERAKGFPAVVGLIRHGPPIVTKLISRFINLNEFVIHHEDLRRANGLGPRQGIDDLQDALWSQYRHTARMTPGLPKGFGMVLQRPGGDTITTGKAPSVTVTGDPVEIGLYLFGRHGASQATLSGDPSAVAAFGGADLGL